jgi:hypothetical protein
VKAKYLVQCADFAPHGFHTLRSGIQTRRFKGAIWKNAEAFITHWKSFRTLTPELQKEIICIHKNYQRRFWPRYGVIHHAD